MEYVTEEEVEVLRQKESQLMGESQQIATMVEKLQSRADLLKKRAKALDALKNLWWMRTFQNSWSEWNKNIEN